MNLKKTKKPVRMKAAVRQSTAPMIAETDYDDDLEPNMKLGRAFMVVLLLHVVAVGAIFAFNSLQTDPMPGPELAGVRLEEGEQRVATSGMPGAAGNDSPMMQTATATTAASAPSNPVGTTAPAATQRLDGSIAHTLRSGDTLDSLARQYGVAEEAILRANSLTRTAVLRVGMELVIPPVERAQAAVPSEVQQFLQPQTTTPAPAAQGTATRADSGVAASGSTYTVMAGDNPYSIARKHGVSMEALLKLNGIEDPRRLQIGQVLEIPAP